MIMQIRGWRLRLRIAGEPEANGAGLGIVRIAFENFQVMEARLGRFMKLLGVEVAEGKMGATVVGKFFEKFFKFGDSTGEVIVLFQQQSEIVASVERIGTDGDSAFVCGNRSGEIAGLGAG